jgi:ComF family protein
MFESAEGIVNQCALARLTAGRVISRLLAQTLFPPRCCLCSFPGESLDLDLCTYCRAALPWNAEHGEPYFVAMRFEQPADELIRRLKYHGIVANARVLGVLLAQAVEEACMPLPRLLVPVPLHPAKLRERGFNQAAALAGFAGAMLGISSVHSVVRRMRNTPSQTALDVSQRQINVRGAFAVGSARHSRMLLDAEHVAIVDDVITTGSTVNELRRVLLAAGVRKVDVWAVARAMPR